MQVQESHVEFSNSKTWYAVYGDLASEQIPLLGIHGGPGHPHQVIEGLTELADRGRPVVLYDQIGSGNSPTPEDAPIDWTVNLFVDELDLVRNALDVDRISMLGHSWGGALALEYLLAHPESGVEKLILSSPLTDSRLWAEAAAELMQTLPPDVLERMRTFEANDDTDAQEYRDLYNEFYYDKFICRAPTYPEALARADEVASFDVYSTMWGTEEDKPTGVLKDWTVLDRLGSITVPTLVISGKYEIANSMQTDLAAEAIKGSKRVVFENSAHFPMLEEPESYINTVAEFLDSPA